MRSLAEWMGCEAPLGLRSKKSNFDWSYKSLFESWPVKASKKSKKNVWLNSVGMIIIWKINIWLIDEQGYFDKKLDSERRTKIIETREMFKNSK